ncbi:xaa-pro aminopeptidase 1 [Holotrichia oblita]|uniref:Xaa-pro aminopeptidase 1 n=1 Tax=Holotrichia oblita TaxID=644536 RepID=A0ACB9T0L6_HOLOL|nr:xaa-pro aminopeptidase 1 [Holotrichia oblita]
MQSANCAYKFNNDSRAAFIYNGLGYDELRATGQLRKACSVWGSPIQPPGRVSTTDKLAELRKVMNSETSLKTKPIDAFLATSDNAHQSEYVAAYDKRIEYISGFSGSKGEAIITQKEAVMWTDGRYHLQADDQLNCDWYLMREGEKNIPSISEWLKKHLKPFSRVGADPKYVSAYDWQDLEDDLNEVNISLVEVKENPIDLIWKNHEEAKIEKSIFVLDVLYAGVNWTDKVEQVRKIVRDEGADAIVVTALDEIAWLLNIRGRDIPHNPFVSSYVILSERAIYMYVELSKLTPNVSEHLNINASSANTVFVYAYDKIWTELPTLAQNWKRVMLPTRCVFSKGASQKIVSPDPETETFTRRVAHHLFESEEESGRDREHEDSPR